MEWDDQAPINFLLKQHMRHVDRSAWRAYYRDVIKRLVYTEVPISSLSLIKPDFKLSKDRLAHWLVIADSSIPFGTLYVHKEEGSYVVLDGNHRLHVLSLRNEPTARVAYDPELNLVFTEGDTTCRTK